MKNINKSIIKLLGIILSIALILSQTDNIRGLIDPERVHAIGDLTVNWGIPGGNYVGPVFTVNGMAPGQSESRIVSVKNNAPAIRPVGIRGIKLLETGNISDVLELVIKRNGIPIYGSGSVTGKKTLTQFFSESADTEGVFLFNQPSGNISQYEFLVTFNREANDDYQGKSIRFNLEIGISIDLPSVCEGISYTSSPIIGSYKSEKLNGTDGNDIILGLEGSDTINGKGGDDCIISGAGSDRISGGNGNDKIFGGKGSDEIQGNAGNDLLYGEQDWDEVKGGAGMDECVAESEKQCEI